MVFYKDMSISNHRFKKGDYLLYIHKGKNVLYMKVLMRSKTNPRRWSVDEELYRVLIINDYMYGYITGDTHLFDLSDTSDTKTVKITEDEARMEML